MISEILSIPVESRMKKHNSGKISLRSVGVRVLASVKAEEWVKGQGQHKPCLKPHFYGGGNKHKTVRSQELQ